MPVTRNQSNATNQAKAASVDAPGPSGQGDDGDNQGTSGAASLPRSDSPENCSICLESINNKSFTSSCAHSFCFVCLKQWSKVKPECPLCKQPFTSIFHNIRSNQSYEIYDLPLNPTRHPSDFLNTLGPTMEPSSYVWPASASLHFTPFFMPELDADLTLGNFSRFQFRHNRSLMPSTSNFQNEHPYAFSMLSSHNHVNAASWPGGAEDFRRQVYRRHMGPPVTVLGTENNNYILTPAMVRASAHRTHRIMPWLTRELRVLLRSYQNVRMAIGIIQPLLSQVMLNSQTFHDRVTPLIGRRTRSFIREFVAFANSAMTMQQYDRKSMYRRRESPLSSSQIAMYDEDESSSSNSSSDDDVVEVTAVSLANNPVTQVTASATLLPPPPYPSDPSTMNLNLPSSSGTHLEMAEDRVSVSSESDDPVFRPDQQGAESDGSRAGSDIVILKYDKPWNERSPIRLSTDSEKEGPDERKSRKKKSKRKKKKRSDEPGTSKDKCSKSSKSHSKSKGKTKSRPQGEDNEQDSCSSGPSGRRQRSSSPSESRQRSKKHKKNHERHEKDPDQDRDLVDRLFAEAFYQQSGSQASGSGSVAGSSKSKEKSSRSSDRSKRKRKHKSRRQSSESPSYSHSYKKHPSGHKKSSDARKRNNESGSERSRHNRTSTSSEGALRISQPSSSSMVSLTSVDQPTSTATYSQPPIAGYMPAMPDTVQHIPLNLWVSTWSSVPHVSFQSSSTAPRPLGSTSPLPAPATALAPPPPIVNPGVSEDSQTVSTDSSADSDDDSADTQDYEMSTASTLAQTKQWLESSSFEEVSSSTVASAIAANGNNQAAGIVAQEVSVGQSAPRPVEDEQVDVLTIDSDDEDCVVVSHSDRDSSDDSDNDVTVMNVETAGSVTNSQCLARLTGTISSSQCNSDPGPCTSRRVPPIRIKLNRFMHNPKVSGTFQNPLEDSSEDDDEDERSAEKQTLPSVLPTTVLSSQPLSAAPSVVSMSSIGSSLPSLYPQIQAGIMSRSRLCLQATTSPQVSLTTGSTLTSSVGTGLFPQTSASIFPGLSSIQTRSGFPPFPALPTAPAMTTSMSSFAPPTLPHLPFYNHLSPSPLLPPLPPLYSTHSLSSLAPHSETTGQDSLPGLNSTSTTSGTVGISEGGSLSSPSTTATINEPSQVTASADTWSSNATSANSEASDATTTNNITTAVYNNNDQTHALTVNNVYTNSSTVLANNTATDVFDRNSSDETTNWTSAASSFISNVFNSTSEDTTKSNDIGNFNSVHNITDKASANHSNNAVNSVFNNISDWVNTALYSNNASQDTSAGSNADTASNFDTVYPDPSGDTVKSDASDLLDADPTNSETTQEEDNQTSQLSHSNLSSSTSDSDNSGAVDNVVASAQISNPWAIACDGSGGSSSSNNTGLASSSDDDAASTVATAQSCTTTATTIWSPTSTTSSTASSNKVSALNEDSSASTMTTEPDNETAGTSSAQQAVSATNAAATPGVGPDGDMDYWVTLQC